MRNGKSTTVTAHAEPNEIEVVNAREHNLAIDRLAVPKRSLVVFTGVSGSGKSSLAFDTLYAEGQRRYVETLSAYARQFLGQLDRPHVDKIRGLSPTIAIEQKSSSGNPRSTVGTITEIYDYLRVLFARVGEQRCYVCGEPVSGMSADEIARELLTLKDGTKLEIRAPLVTMRKGEFREIFEDLKQRGFARVTIKTGTESEGTLYKLDELPKLDKKKKHTIELVVDRITVRADDRGRLVEAIELALKEGKGTISVKPESGEAKVYSEQRTCHGISYPALSPQSFSFNTPMGFCQDCNGLGTRLRVDPQLIVPDETKTIREGAIVPWATAMARESWRFKIADAAAKACKVSLDMPWKKIPAEKKELLFHGVKDKRISVSWGSSTSTSHGTWAMKFEGVIGEIMRRYNSTTSESARDVYRKFMSELPCDACGQKRLRKESLAVFVGGKHIADVTNMTVRDASDWTNALSLSKSQAQIAAGALLEIRARLSFLLNVGLEYLTLDRSGPTLSGGEAQRIRLASQLGSELSGVMYVLDEPSIGLHQRDNGRLIATLQRLRDLGNTVLVVEHDEETIRAADYVVDFGPGAGHMGGKVVFQGTPEELEADPTSLTGQYMSGQIRIEVPTSRRAPKGFLEIKGAKEHNLKNIDVKIPLGVLTAVTGVSGAGKSSLINGILLPALARELHDSTGRIGAHSKIVGLGQIDKAISIDQQPIGRTPRSNPGTYTKCFDLIREHFAQLPDSKARGFDPGRFSFNVKGGRCEACHGDGVVKVEMHFLADVYVTCEACGGKRYNTQTLGVRWKGKNISEVLDASIDDCLELFQNVPTLRRILETLRDVGLGYMKIGQTATTMSGGEAQRVKLSRELGKVQTGRTLYVLDEPTTGLHFEDTRKLLGVLERLVEIGNSVLVIEHNLDVVKRADWVIDLGPEGGAGGGTIIAEGTPEMIADAKGSYTGQYLGPLLAKTAARAAKRERAARQATRDSESALR